jgi:CheY-like chemotaxis protein
MTERTARTVVVADDDLFFSARISTSLASLGYRPVVVRTPETLLAHLHDAPAAAILNLAAHRFDAAQAIRAAKLDPATRTVPLRGFCGHQDAERQSAARAAGCDLVVTNGAISGGLKGLLRSLLEPLPQP